MDYFRETIATYDKIAEDFAKSHDNINFLKREYEIFKNLIQGEKVIDIGCGTGRDAQLFISDNFDYVGIDASAGMLEEARKSVPSANFLQMDFRKLAFPTNYFDGFWAAASLLHIPKKELPTILEEIKKVVKPHGIGFISMKAIKDREEGIITQTKFGGIKRYFAFYKEEELKTILENNGFQVIQNFRFTEDSDNDWLQYFIEKS